MEPYSLRCLDLQQGRDHSTDIMTEIHKQHERAGVCLPHPLIHINTYPQCCLFLFFFTLQCTQYHPEKYISVLFQSHPSFCPISCVKSFTSLYFCLYHDSFHTVSLQMSLSFFHSFSVYFSPLSMYIYMHSICIPSYISSPIHCC